MQSRCWVVVSVASAIGGVCETSYINAGKFLDTIVHLPRGVHEIPVQTMRPDTTSQMHWAMCVAYYVPPGMAAQLIDVVDSANIKKKHVQVA